MVWLLSAMSLISALALLSATPGRSFHRLGPWVVALLLISSVNPLLLHDSPIPEALRIPSSNLTICLSFILLQFSILELRQRPRAGSLWIGGGFVALALLIHLVYHAQPPLRSASHALLFSAEIAWILVTLMGPNGRPIPGRGKYLLILTLLVNVALFGFRLHAGLFHPERAEVLFFGQQMQAQMVFVLVLIFSVMLYTFALLVMVLELVTEEIHGLLITDVLTGIGNRRKLIEMINFQSADDSSVPDALIMVDIDHFKSINDTYGHDFGDVILKQFSTALKQALRGEDSIYRWGGEEFVILLERTDFATASEVAERLRLRIEQTRFAMDLKITASLGYTDAHFGEQWRRTLNRVDKALYEAKNLGRNQTFGLRSHDVPSENGETPADDRVGNCLKKYIDNF